MRIPAPIISLVHSSRGRARKWTLRAIAALLVLYALYVLTTWAFLTWGGSSWLLRSAKDVHVEFASGYSLWPGAFRLSEADVRFQDYNIEMRIRAERIDAKLQILPLTKKKIVVDELVARGARYSMLHRVHDGSSQARRLAAFPVIPGFDRPKVYDAPPPPPGGSKWTVQVNSVRADVEEAWLLEYRLQGHMHAQGGFSVGEQVRIEKSRVRFESVKATVGGRPFLTDLEGEAEAYISSFESGLPIAKVLPKVSGRVGMTARLDSISPVNLYLDERESRIDGSGTLALGLQVLDGRIHAGKLGLEAVDWKLSPSDSERGLNACSPCVLPQRGSADGKVRARLEPGSSWLASTGELKIEQLELPLGDFRTQATGKLEWACRGAGGHLECDPFEIRMSHVDMQSEDRKSALWMTALGRDVSLNWKKRSLDAVLAVRSSDPKSLLRLMAEDSWPSQVGLGLVRTGELTASLQIIKDESTYVVALRDLQTGSVEARGHLVAASSVTAAWAIHLPHTSWGIIQRGGSSQVRPLIGDEWLQSRIDEM